MAQRVRRVVAGGAHPIEFKMLGFEIYAQAAQQAGHGLHHLPAFAQHARVPIFVEAFVQHWLLELIGAQNAVKIAMAKFVNGHKVQ